MENNTSQFISVNGRNLHVELHGQVQNPPVIFLHHGLGSTYSWRPQIRAFTRAGYFVIVYDRWGYGKSDARNSLISADFKEDLADLVALIETFAIPRLAVIGHSDGGTLALYYAARYGERVASLVTISAHIYVEETMKPGIMNIRQAYNQNMWFRDGLMRIHGDKTQQVFSNWYDGWLQLENLDWDIRPIIRNITCPALIVQGGDDEHATPKHAQDIAEAIPGSELWLIPGGGHMLPQDMADTFNSKAIDFLKAHYVS